MNTALSRLVSGRSRLRRRQRVCHAAVLDALHRQRLAPVPRQLAPLHALLAAGPATATGHLAHEFFARGPSRHVTSTSRRTAPSDGTLLPSCCCTALEGPAPPEPRPAPTSRRPLTAALAAP